MLPVEQPFKTYTDRDGHPLDSGYVYFGQPDQNPITAPVTVYWDAAGTQPAAQPLRTENGYIVRAGTPANVFFSGSYSELVQDKRGRQVFYARTSNDFSSATALLNYIASIASSIGSSLMGFLQAGIGAVLRTVQDKLRDTISVKDFGAVGDGVANDTTAIQKAMDYAAGLPNGANVLLPPGEYKVTGTLNLLCDKVGLVGNGARIVATGFSQSTVLFSITHSTTTIFPSFKIVRIEGLRLQSSSRNGICFSVVGNGVDRFSAHIHYRWLDIKDFHIAWNYGDYAFSPMISECSASGVNQVFKQAGTISTGAHFVFDRCLFTTIGNKTGNIIAFDLGGVNTYKFIACDLESADYTLMTTSGSDVYLYGCHMELDVGSSGANASLFTVTNTDYGHFAFDHCTGFWWQSTSDVPPLYTVGDRMASFVIQNSRVIVNNGITPASNTFLSNYYHPFLCNKAFTLKGPMNPKTGQAFLYSSKNNNGFTNWDFANAISTDFTTGGGGVTAVSDVPYGSAKCMDMGFSAFSASAMIPVPDNAQMGMITFWGKTTIFVSGQMSLEVRLYNANSVQTDLFVVNITNVGINQWDRFQIDTLSNISNKGTKFVKITFSCPGTVAYRVAYPFIDFA
jgi:hypothetical protein